MRVVLTDDALCDLDAIPSYTATHHPIAADALTRRFNATLRRIGA